MAMQSQHIMVFDFSLHLSRFSLTILSLFQVGGLILFRLSLLFPPQGLMIYSIKVKIVQTFHLQSPIDSTHSSTPPPHSQTIFILDSSHPPNYAKVSEESGGRSGSATPSKSGVPLKVLKKDEMWKVNHLARLPNDNHIRPSTHEGTKSPISVNHSVRHHPLSLHSVP